MNRLTVLFVVVVCFEIACAAATNGTADRQHENVTKANDSCEMALSVEEKMKELRIEMLKFQILSTLNLKEMPPSPQEPSEESKEMIRLLVQEDEERQQTQHHYFDTEERLIVHSKNNGIQCLQSNVSFCKMFRYELSPTLNTSTVDFWVYKLSENSRWISLSISYSSSTTEENYSDIFYFELNQTRWNKLQLPRIWLSPSWNDTISYSVEIIGQNFEYSGNRRPFLMISKSSFMASRQRREVTCDTNESCCLQPLRVSFTDIGFNWVLYPEELEANMCIGKCTRDHSAQRTHYERAITKVLETDNTLQESLGECWTLCCKPKILEPVRVFYNDTEGVIHDQYIPDLVVKSCSCS